MRKPVTALAAVAFAVLSSAASAAPVTVSQTVSLDQIVDYGPPYTTAAFTAGAWSALFPFTQASQITGIRWTFASTSTTWNDQGTWPVKDGGGVPGVELGVVDDSAVRTAFVSFVPGSQVYDMGPGAFFDLTQGLLADGAIEASLGAFFNFAGGGFSEGTELGPTSTLTLEVTGDLPVPNRTPEPASLALVALAAVAAGAGAMRRRA